LGNFALIAVAIALVAMNRKPGIGFCNVLNRPNISSLNCGLSRGKAALVKNPMGTKFTYIERPHQSPFQGAGTININRDYNLTGIPGSQTNPNHATTIYSSGLVHMLRSIQGSNRDKSPAFCDTYTWNNAQWIPFTLKLPDNFLDWPTSFGNYYDIVNLQQAIDQISIMGYAPGDNLLGFVRVNYKCHSETGLPLEWIIINNGDWAVSGVASQSEAFGGF